MQPFNYRGKNIKQQKYRIRKKNIYIRKLYFTKKYNYILIAQLQLQLTFKLLLLQK